jgi:malonyl-CoA/methylmalonyl-CoA synthetase
LSTVDSPARSTSRAPAWSGELFPSLVRPAEQAEITVAGESLTYAELARAAGGVAKRLRGSRRVVVYAAPTLDTVVSVVGALAAGVPVVTISTHSGRSELEHIIRDSEPEIVLASSTAELPAQLAALPRLPPDGPGGDYREEAADDPERTALIIYTSGTTGLPKGVQIPRRAIATNLDGLADAWAWSPDDVLVHALPLFHAHGLVLGTLGPLRRGGQLVHVGRFEPEAVARALAAGGTMMFGVPTMYSRMADACTEHAEVARGLADTRLLVSGSAALPAIEHQRIEHLTGQRIVERYGLTETLMNTAIRVDAERTPGYVGPPLDHVELKLLDDDCEILDTWDDETFGEIALRGPNLFTGYLNRPEATAEAMHEGWFLTGDLATRRADGYIRIIGRRSTDLIKSGGYRIGAGEVEGVLLEHPAVAEVAVKGLPDAELGERVVAWVVLRPGVDTQDDELIDHAATLLSTHKRPREIRFVDEMPRNPMGKLVKSRLS